jgi:hypothetical protein
MRPTTRTGTRVARAGAMRLCLFIPPATRQALLLLTMLSASASLAACEDCTQRVRQYAAEREASSSARIMNEKLDQFPLTTEGGTTPIESDDGTTAHARVTKTFPARWPQDLVTPFHAPLLKSVEEVDDGRTTPLFLALFESTDPIEEVERYFERARTSRAEPAPPFGRPAWVDRLQSSRRVVSLSGRGWSATVFLSDRSHGHTRIGYQVVLLDDLYREFDGILRGADAGESPSAAEATARAHAPARSDGPELSISVMENNGVDDADRVLERARPNLSRCFADLPDSPEHRRRSFVLNLRVLPTGKVGGTSTRSAADKSEAQGFLCIAKQLEFAPPRTENAVLTVLVSLD